MIICFGEGRLLGNSFKFGTRASLNEADKDLGKGLGNGSRKEIQSLGVTTKTIQLGLDTKSILWTIASVLNVVAFDVCN